MKNPEGISYTMRTKLIRDTRAKNDEKNKAKLVMLLYFSGIFSTLLMIIGFFMIVYLVIKIII